MRGTIATGLVVGMGLLGVVAMGTSLQGTAAALDQTSTPIEAGTALVLSPIESPDAAPLEWDLSSTTAETPTPDPLVSEAAGDLVAATDALRVAPQSQTAADLALEAQRLIDCLRTRQQP